MVMKHTCTPRHEPPPPNRLGKIISTDKSLQQRLRTFFDGPFSSHLSPSLLCFVKYNVRNKLKPPADVRTHRKTTNFLCTCLTMKSFFGLSSYIRKPWKIDSNHKTLGQNGPSENIHISKICVTDRKRIHTQMTNTTRCNLILLAGQANNLGER